MMKMPTYYVPHGGGPCFFMDWTPPDTWTALGQWLGDIPNALPYKPTAFLTISAHWEEPEFTLATKPDPALLYDYYGFPAHTYDLSWPAAAATTFFPRIAELLLKSGLDFATDSMRDFDHGVFVPGLLLFPEADMPSLQISLRAGLDPAAHIALGKALAPLRDEGVFICGSGMSYHNMRAFHFWDNDPIPGTELFDDWLTKTLCREDRETRERNLIAWEKAPGARAAHPREEHLLPLMVVAGAAGDDAGQRTFAGQAMGARLSGYRFS